MENLNSTPPQVFIYGAYGYTGRLVVEEAIQNGIKPLIGGRNAEKLEALAKEFGLEFTAFSLDNAPALANALSKVKVVVHCAGPFAYTAKPMAEACLAHGVHYLDITGELDVFEYMAQLDEKARKAGIVMLPGIGFDVVPTDCLASFLKKQLPDAHELKLAFKGVSQMSRGTALTAVDNLDKGGAIRKNGRIVPVPGLYEVRKVDYGKGPRLSMAIPWGDVSTAYHSTGIPNITVYMATNKQMVRGMRLAGVLKPILKLKAVKGMLAKRVRKSVYGPSAELRQTARSYVWGQANNGKGQVVQARLETAEAYRLTALSAVEATARLLEHPPPPGFYTPSKAFGADYVLGFPDTTRELLKD